MAGRDMWDRRQRDGLDGAARRRRAADRTCRGTPLPARADDLSGLPPTYSTWAPRRPSATRSWTTRPASGGRRPSRAARVAGRFPRVRRPGAGRRHLAGGPSGASGVVASAADRLTGEENRMRALIVGGGPAGTTAAIALGRVGIETLVRRAGGPCSAGRRRSRTPEFTASCAAPARTPGRGARPQLSPRGRQHLRTRRRRRPPHRHRAARAGQAIVRGSAPGGPRWIFDADARRHARRRARHGATFAALGNAAITWRRSSATVRPNGSTWSSVPTGCTPPSGSGSSPTRPSRGARAK